MSQNLDHLNGDNKPELCEPSVVKNLQENVDGLYNLRDRFFESNPIENAALKTSEVEAALKTVLQNFENVSLDVCENRAMVYYLQGRALNISAGYNKDAEDLLSKAVKLDPKLVEAWNELGDVYWKKKNIEEAKNCFSRALVHGKNKVSLRNLSMVLRQRSAKSAEEVKSNIEESMECAKEAVQLDTQDGLSWSILANAYLSSYFNISQNPQTLKLTMSAYAQAEKDVIARYSPEIHYNKAMVLKYEEEYQQALDSLHLAHQYDPKWQDPIEKEKELLKYLQSIEVLTKQKGKLKGKKIKQLVQALDDKQLGPYYGGSVTSKGQTVKLDFIPFSKLSPGINTEKVVMGKVVCGVHNEDSVPFTFCMIDAEETCLAVSLYNLMEGKGVIIGDTVAIPEPYLTQVKVKTKTTEISFDMIRVETPVLMVVNGRKIGRDQQASIRLSTFGKTD